MGTTTATRMRRRSQSSWAKRERRKNSIERLAPASPGCARSAWHDAFCATAPAGVSSGEQLSSESCTGLAATELRGGHPARPMYSKCRSTERVWCTFAGSMLVSEWAPAEGLLYVGFMVPAPTATDL